MLTKKTRPQICVMFKSNRYINSKLYDIDSSRLRDVKDGLCVNREKMKNHSKNDDE